MTLSKRWFYLLVCLFISSAFSSCLNTPSFTKEELKFANPFSKADTGVYKSSKGQTDTIIYHAAIKDVLKIRSGERGFYNENRLIVYYELSNGSYHKFTVHSSNGEHKHLISFYKNDSKEICFLGLIFNDQYIDSICNNPGSTISFIINNAQYSGMNINEGINSFQFDFNKGIVSFKDKYNSLWLRIK